MNELLDTCVSALLVSDCRDSLALHRLQRAAWRIEQLLASIGFPETAKTLRNLRDECGELPAVPLNGEPIKPAPIKCETIATPAVADPRDEEPLTGRKRRKGLVLP